MSNFEDDPLAAFRFLTMRELSKCTGYTIQHIYRMQRAGHFPARVQLGKNRVGVRYLDFKQWVESRPTLAAPTDPT